MAAPNTAIVLSSVRYNESHHEVICSFRNRSQVKSQRYTFFPSLITSLPSARLFDALPKSDWRKIQVTGFSNGTNRVVGASFSVLQRVFAFAEKVVPNSSLLLSPERQFLLEQGWGLGDAFSFNKEPERLNDLVFPDHAFGFLPQPFFDSLFDWLNSGEIALAQSWCERLAWAQLLFVPPEQVPEEKESRIAMAIENQFFLAGLVSSGKEPPAIQGRFFHLPLHVFEHAVEFDFRNVASLLCTRPFFNLSLEKPCSCCKPLNAAAANLLPSSLVKLRVLSNGLFFESLFPSFAQTFHRAHLESRAREERQREFGLAFPPIGPLHAGDLVECPLADAERLEQDGHGVIAGLGSVVQWFCLEHESALAAWLSLLHNRVTSVSVLLKQLESTALSEEHLKGLAHLEQNPSFFFFRVVRSVTEEWFLHLPTWLSSSKSHSFLFCPQFSQQVGELRAFSIARFVAFSQANGFRAISSSSNERAFIPHSPGFGLANAFSQAERFPAPRVADWHFG